MKSCIEGVRWLQLGGHFDGVPRAFALVDDADWEFVSRWRWSLVQGYAMRSMVREDGERRLVGLHRELLGLGFGDPRQSDHINRDKLDNRRSNLRIVSHAQNCQNMPRRGGTSEYRGVRWNRARWQAYGHVEGTFVHVGMFNDEDEAGDAAAAFRSQHMVFAVD